MPIAFYIDDDVFHTHFAAVSYIIKFFLYRSGINDTFSLRPVSALARLEPGTVCVVYSQSQPDISSGKYCRIWCQRDFWDTHTAPQPKPETYSINKITFPLVFQRPEAESPVVCDRDTASINFDLFAAMFFVLCRVEEYKEFTPDEHQRFPVTESWLYHSALLREPVVDNWVLLLATTLRNLGERSVDMSLSGEQKAIINLTFDVDLVKYYKLRRLLGAPLLGLLREKNPGAIFSYSRQAVRYLLGKSPDPYWGFAQIKNLQQKLAAEVTYFIFARKETEWEDYDLTRDQRLQDQLTKVIGTGDEIALHCTYDCLDTPEEFGKEKEKLAGIFQSAVEGVRHHYLRFKVPDSWMAAAKAHLTYDATLGFAEYEGFRAGTAFPFVPFDVKGEAEIPIVEIPLNIMDVSLRHYRRLSILSARQIIEELFTACQKVSGLLSILWHTNNLQGFGWDKWRHLLADVLREAAAQGGWEFASSRQIAAQSLQRWHKLEKRLT